MTEETYPTSGVKAESSAQLFPSRLRQRDRWMVWKEDQSRKIPRAPQHGGVEVYASAMDEENWMTFERAEDYVNMVPSLSGLTYSLQHDDGLALLDYDDVRDPESGEILPQVMQQLHQLGGFAQVSTSGTGVHAIVEGTLPERMKSLVVDLDGHPDAELEIYDGDRFIAMTGEKLDSAGSTIRNGQSLIDSLVENHADEGGHFDAPEMADDWEPAKDRDEIEDLDDTSNIEDIFDAIKHTTYRDITLRSEHTEGDHGSRMSFDPYWEQSDSGTRLGYENGGWIYRKGNVGLDALQVVALEEGIIRRVEDYPEGEDFWNAVEELRKRGAHIPEYEYDAEPEAEAVSTLPIARLDRLSHEERRRYARKRNISWPDVDEVRERLYDSIMDTVRDGDYAVKSAPTGAGKTHTIATEHWRMQPEVTDDKPVIHAHRTREARDQARQMSDEAGVDAYTLKGRKELCPVARGDHDPHNDHGNPGITVNGEPISEWIDHKCRRQGLPFSHAHRWAEQEIDRDLPCQMDECECAAIGQFDGIPRDDDGSPSHDVIHCTQQFLNVPGLRMHTHVFVDEKPSFGIDLEPREIRESVNAYLQYIDAPVDDYNELVAAARTGKDPNAPTQGTVEGVVAHEHHDTYIERTERTLSGENERVECPECKGTGDRREGGAINEDLSAYPEHGGAKASNACPECHGNGYTIENRGEPPLEWYRNTPEGHALAPAFARAIWNAEESAGGRKSARVSFRPPRWGNQEHDEAGWNRVFVDMVLNEQWEVEEAECLPDFSLAETVIGLDAHPQPRDPMWMANIHPDMTTDETLSTEERTLYRRYERGLFTVQVGEGIQPVASGEWLDGGQGDKFDVNIQQLRDHYGEDFDSAITSKNAKQFVRESMEDAGIEEPEMMHYGAEESRNDFAGKNAGLVAGSIDPGDEMVLNLCARLDFDVEPCQKECPNCGGSGHGDDDEWCGVCNGDGMKRERGRTFEGEDAEQADAVLQGVREHHVAQSAGRWARDADDPEDNATVYIITEAAPAGFIDAKAPGVTWTTDDDQKERLEYVRDSATGATAKEVAEATGCSKQAAWRTLSKAENNGLLERTPGDGPYGADIYTPGNAFSPDGAADLSADGKKPLRSGYGVSNTFTVTVDVLPHVAFNADGGTGDDWEHQSTWEWFEAGGPPPSSAD